MQKCVIKVQFNLEPGLRNSFFVQSKDQAREAFQEIFPNSSEYTDKYFLPPCSTTLHIVITSISIGAGIITAEMLKECGKDLWKAVKKLILPKEKQANIDFFEENEKDKLRLEIRIGEFSMADTLVDLEQNSEAQVEKFLKSRLNAMLETYLSKKN